MPDFWDSEIWSFFYLRKTHFLESIILRIAAHVPLQFLMALFNFWLGERARPVNTIGNYRGARALFDLKYQTDSRLLSRLEHCGYRQGRDSSIPK
jgi:hypothetical protein